MRLIAVMFYRKLPSGAVTVDAQSTAESSVHSQAGELS